VTSGGGGVLEHGVVVEVWGLSAIMPLPAVWSLCVFFVSSSTARRVLLLPLLVLLVGGALGAWGRRALLAPGSANGCHARFFCGNRFVLNLLIHLHIVLY
jgi:hypothetical protein